MIETEDHENSTLRLLCIGVEPNFIAYLLTTAEKLHLSLDTCRTIPEAREKIFYFSYDIYIFDLRLSEPIFNLIKDIREKDKEKERSFIAIISESSHEIVKRDLLEKKEDVEFILRKPIDPQQIENFIKYLDQYYSSLSNHQTEKKIQTLKQNYTKNIYKKIELLTALTKAVQQDPNLIHLTELKEAIHKIGGSAGSYDYFAVSIICKEMEQEITQKISFQDNISRQWLSSLDAFIEKVKLGFQTPPEESEDITLQPSIVKPVFYIVNDDKKFLELLQRVNEQFLIDLRVESNPQKAIEQLHQIHFKPHVIILSQKFKDFAITAFDIIESQHYKPEKQQVPILALLLDEENIDVRIEAMKIGISYIFRKPVSAYVLLKAMKDVLKSEHLRHIRVLVLDDDRDFCHFVIAALSKKNITVRAIYDSQNLFKTLEEYNPHILLLDLNLPKHDGIDLLKTLRQDAEYRSLMIILVTNLEEKDVIANAYSVNADDILYKPLDKSILQNRVLNLFQRKTTWKEPSDPKNYIGLVHLEALMTDLQECLTKTEYVDQYLVLFEIHHFSDLMVNKGHIVAKNLLVAISNQLQWETDDKMNCFSYQSIFAIIFEGQSLTSIEIKMHDFLSRLVQNEKHVSISFNCSITPISNRFENASQILERAEQGLQEASEKEFTTVKIVNMFPKEGVIAKKELIIIDSDEELLKILKKAFESHGILVHTYKEGGQALSHIRSEGRLPSLIISERYLADMDGLDLYLKLKTRFRIAIPFYVLTVFSSDVDVSEGIKLGILEYIVKPFNISLLVQKVLKFIFKS